MTSVTRAAVRLSTALALVMGLSAPAMAAPIQVLTQDDARLYASAFDAAQKGDFATTDTDLAKVKDKSLTGPLTLLKLLHPTAYVAKFNELTAWLGSFGDQPGAERVYALSMRRKPSDAAPPEAPRYLTIDPSAETVTRNTRPANPARGFAGRDAYYSGDLNRALSLASNGRDGWIAGLANYRLGRYAEARTWFEGVARDGGQDSWVRSGAAFWAARSAARAGDQEAVEPMLQIARTWPDTFYGMIAQRRSTLQAKITAPPSEVPRFQPASYVVSNDLDDAERLVRANPRAWRAAALIQVGRIYEARQEIRTGLAASRDDQERKGWQALSKSIDGPAAAVAAVASTGVNVADYPMPELFPTGGFTLDRALVYAITRQESRFNPYAVSHAGAMGLMQVVPAAAARAAGDDQLLVNPLPLLDASTNLRVGQDHFTWLMEKLVGYHLLPAIASYNCGPGPVMKLQKTIGADDDLMLIESLPAPETRDYVEHVAAAYWTYRRLFGSDSGTLDALASGTSAVDLRLDH
jgi:soluble lytic murein transglycosylase-like protein